jgi:hypothetical protein
MAADSAENDSSNNVVGAAVRGGGLLMLLAFLQRASTFCLNILLQRSMMGSKDFAAYGAARYLSISRTCFQVSFNLSNLLAVVDAHVVKIDNQIFESMFLIVLSPSLSHDADLAA